MTQSRSVFSAGSFITRFVCKMYEAHPKETFLTKLLITLVTCEYSGTKQFFYRIELKAWDRY